MPVKTKPLFTCPRCGFESWNDNDRVSRYCARCKVWIEDKELTAVPEKIHWSDAMIEALIDMRKRRMPLYRCAELIGVGYGTVCEKAHELGLAGRLNRGRKGGEKIKDPPRGGESA